MITKTLHNIKTLHDIGKSLLLDRDSRHGASEASRYWRMKVSMTLLMAAISLFFLFVVVLTSRIWLKNLLKEDKRTQLTWQMESAKFSIETFINVKLSALNFIAQERSYDDLLKHDTLYECFENLRKNFGDVVVDLGVIDSGGIMRAYAGPYNLAGRNYMEQDWFQKITLKEFYVSDVFMGYRKIPHFAIAVRKHLPRQGDFWVLRATIDMERLSQLMSTVRLKENDDVFIINSEGVLQTPSRTHGGELLKIDIKAPLVRPAVSLMDVEDRGASGSLMGFARIEKSPWTLVADIRSKEDAAITRSFINELMVVFILCILIVIAITLRMAHVMVNWIKEADHRRDIAFSEIEHSNKLASIGRLSAGVAHEINNPLSIINQNAGLMKDLIEMSLEPAGIDAPEERFKALINDIRTREKFLSITNGILDAVNRCRTITHRLLGFARRIDVAAEHADINDTVLEVIGFLEKEIIFRDIHLVKNFQESLPAVTTDKGQLQQVLLNIINNAVDAVSRGGVIEVSTALKGERAVTISVRDDGGGIPAKQLNHIFEPFFTTKEKGKGTGLGLFISYGIMEKLGGRLLVESEEGKWTLLTIELPMGTDGSM
jgi:two-component system NtrC family sensor kinase